MQYRLPRPVHSLPATTWNTPRNHVLTMLLCRAPHHCQINSTPTIWENFHRKILSKSTSLSSPHTDGRLLQYLRDPTAPQGVLQEEMEMSSTEVLALKLLLNPIGTLPLIV